MQKRRKTVKRVPLPQSALANYHFEPVHYVDAFSIALRQGRSSGMPELAWRLFGSKEAYPWYLHWLMNMRDFLVKPFNIRTKEQMAGQWYEERLQQQLPFFKILQTVDDEIILGEDDTHLDFRVSVLRTMENNGMTLTVSTLVRMHNRVGRIYFICIRPFHRFLVPAMMKKAYGGEKKHDY